jgi:DNA-binding NtrC family response regulator
MPESVTVLLVEDDPLIRIATADMLQAGGCDVRAVSTFDDAVQQLGTLPQGATLVTDIVLDGDSSGLRLVKVAHDQRPDLSVIVLSGAVRPSASELPSGVLFCTKPCAPGALITLVQQPQPMPVLAQA